MEVAFFAARLVQGGLTPRETNAEFPVLAVRYGPWKLKSGDGRWMDPNLDDSSWPTVEGGADWRSYGVVFEAVNATGWYRQHLDVAPSILNSTANVTLSIGIIAGADQPFLNGRLLGTTPRQDAA